MDGHRLVSIEERNDTDHYGDTDRESRKKAIWGPVVMMVMEGLQDSDSDVEDGFADRLEGGSTTK